MPDKNTPPSGFQFGLTNLKPVESSKVALTFPDGAKHGGYGAGWRGL